MVAGTSSRFACEGCGKSLVWKSAQVGKKVRCSCGTVMVVPQAPLSGPKSAIPGSLKAPPPTAQVGQAPTLGYVSARPKRAATDALPTDKLIDPVRDIYVPTGVLVSGFLLIGLWGLVGRGINAQMSALVLAAACVSTMIKTIILVLVCIAITAKHGEVSFGMLWPAVLKFSSIILINDAMLIWFEAWQIYRGAIEIRHGVMYIDIWLLIWELFMASFLIGVLLWYLFDIEKEQMLWMGAAIAFASMAIGFGLRFLVVLAVNAYSAAAMPPPPAPPPPPPPPPAAAQATKPATKPVIPETARDKAIREKIEQGELREMWAYNGSTQKSLFKKLIEARVRRTYIETRGFLPPKLYIELPKDSYDRGACLLACKEYYEECGAVLDPADAKDSGQRYVVLILLR